jgi:hypothetical protein
MTAIRYPAATTTLVAPPQPEPTAIALPGSAEACRTSCQRRLPW